MSERKQWTYATADGRMSLTVDAAFGLIMPPTIAAHIPMRGPLEFYHAQSYGITVQPDAATRSLDEL